MLFTLSPPLPPPPPPVPRAGMYTATSANARTAVACESSINRGLQVSFASGAVMGNGVCMLALSGLWILYLIWTAVLPESSTVDVKFDEVWGYLAGFGFGASSIGMFARVGGGVFTKVRAKRWLWRWLWWWWWGSVVGGPLRLVLACPPSPPALIIATPPSPSPSRPAGRGRRR